MLLDETLGCVVGDHVLRPLTPVVMLAPSPPVLGTVAGSQSLSWITEAGTGRYLPWSPRLRCTSCSGRTGSDAAL